MKHKWPAADAVGHLFWLFILNDTLICKSVQMDARSVQRLALFHQSTQIVDRVKRAVEWAFNAASVLLRCYSRSNP